jgi:predicted ATPase
MLEDSRLVTLTGAGGIGKTRLALAVGEGQLDAAPAGVWLVELATLANQAYVAQAIAQALDVRESAQSSLLNSLLAHLRDKRMLLILDNCEHVIGETAAVADGLLSGCAQLRILATSREPLRIDGELTYRVPSLAVPDAREAARLSASDAADYAAIELFVQRAHATDRQFVVNDETAPTIAEICRRLDGIPLAIELAAARVNVLPIGTLAAKLSDRFAILTGGSRSALPRHQTMRALIDWSFNLLVAAEQRLFERLSVFAGGCELAAAAVLGEGAGEVEVLATLSSLVDKSLVIADMTEREPRYRLLESTRQYAREKLAARGEAELVARLHAQYCAEAAERFWLAFGNMSEAELLRAGVELENWRAALEWALGGHGDSGLGQRLAAASWPVFGTVSIVEGRRWIAAAAQSVDERTPPKVRALLDLAMAIMTVGLGEMDAALPVAARAIAAFEALGDTLHTVWGQWALGVALLGVGRGVEAEPLLDTALANARSHEKARLTGWVLEQLIHARSVRGDLAQARAYATEALGLWAKIGDDRTALVSSILGEAEFRAGNVERALELGQQSLAAERRNPRQRNLAASLLNFAAYAIVCERWEDAVAASREVLASPPERQRLICGAWALQHMVAAAILPKAAAAEPARFRDAALVIGYVDARSAALGSPREYTEEQEYERVRIALHAVLGPNQFERLAAAGAAMSEEVATALALSLDSDEER